MSIRSLADNMELPGRCGDWLAPPPSPPRASRLDTTRRARGGDFYLAKTGDLNWPPLGTFSWSRTAVTAPLFRTGDDLRKEQESRLTPRFTALGQRI